MESSKVSKDNLSGQRDLTERAAFKPLADIFNEILTCPQTTATRNSVRTMDHAGSTSPKSDRISTNCPDAFLLMNSSLANSSSETPAADMRYSMDWRDLACPLEYKFGNGDKMDVRTSNIHLSTISDDDLQNQDKLVWSLHHQLRSDLLRAFSFGSRWTGPDYVYGLGLALPYSTSLRLTGWRSVGNDPFQYPFLTSSLQSPDLLIKFFTFLAFSEESDLGFDTKIERVNHSDFELRFLIQGKHYLTSGVLYDVGADAVCGRVTWVFKAYPQGQANPHPGPCVIKDCWVEDREGKEMEHIIVENVRAAIGHDRFREHFVNVCGHHTHSLSSDFKTNHSATYSQLSQAFVGSRDSHL